MECLKEVESGEAEKRKEGAKGDETAGHFAGEEQEKAVQEVRCSVLRLKWRCTVCLEICVRKQLSSLQNVYEGGKK